MHSRFAKIAKITRVMCSNLIFIQLVRYIKSMNSNRPSESKVVATAESLNITLPIQQELRNLVISHSSRKQGYTKSTWPDVKKLYMCIKSKLSTPSPAVAASQIPFNPATWYTDSTEGVGIRCAVNYLQKHTNFLTEVDFEPNWESEPESADNSFEADQGDDDFLNEEYL